MRHQQGHDVTYKVKLLIHASRQQLVGEVNDGLLNRLQRQDTSTLHQTLANSKDYSKVLPGFKGPQGGTDLRFLQPAARHQPRPHDYGYGTSASHGMSVQEGWHAELTLVHSSRGWDSNPRHHDRKSGTVPLGHSLISKLNSAYDTRV